MTSCLIGAVGVVFAIAGGVLAFQGWPGAPAVGNAPALQVAAAARTATPRTAPSLQLAAPAARVASGGIQASGRTARRHASNAGTTGPRVSTPVQPPAPAPGPAVPPASAPAPTGFAATGRAAIGVTSHTIRSAGALLPQAAPVTNLLADTVDGVGRLVWPGARAVSPPR